MKDVATLLRALEEAVGRDQVLTGDAIDARYLHDWYMTITDGAPFAVVRPATTAEVSAVLRACSASRVGVVPQGGRTGLAGGATPVDGCVVLALERMSGIEEIDAASATMTVRAGTPLQAVCDAARDAGFLFPLDLGARGTCQIGGNIATNAGGNRVIRYGMARELVLGLEVVLADGTVVSSMNKMLKNNTGYDLKQAFIGSEGTLGVITRAVLRLQPEPKSVCTALCAVADYDNGVRLLRAAQQALAGTFSAFEMMWPDFYELVTRKVAGLTSPLPYGYGAYVLVESLGSDQAADQSRFEQALHDAVQQGIVVDAVVAKSGAESASLWRIRDASAEFPRIFWPHVKFDISIPTADIGKFVRSTVASLRARWRDAETVTFGHIGDSNIHFEVKVGDAGQPDKEVSDIVYAGVRQWNGSVSAEHGIGLLKRAYLGYSRSPAELQLMRTLKQALDPQGILNPGKILPPE
jgi:FAD/FMN-containing dehydrogenase